MPCGKCPECLDVKQRGWRLRCFWQAKHTFAHDGFVFFETLTYNNRHLPKYKGLDSFSPAHVRNFFKRLRSVLEAAGYNTGETINDKRVSYLSYLLTCEYGSSELGTHRPHYHIMFFNTIKGLNPRTFKKYINKCWKFGFTDSWYNFDRHCWNQQTTECLKKIDYTCKYVGKNFDYQYEVCTKLGLDENNLSADDKIVLKDYLMNAGPFLRASQGFGLFLMDHLTPDQVLRATGVIDTPQFANLVVNLCMYYKRKLYYDKVEKTTSDGVVHVCYQLNDKGFRMREFCFKDLTREITSRFRTIVYNMDEHDRLYFMDRLCNRSLEDLAIYDMCYRNRCKDVLFMDPLDAFLSRYIVTDLENALQSSDDHTRLAAREDTYNFNIRDTFRDSWTHFDELLCLIENYESDEKRLKHIHADQSAKSIYNLKNFIYS